MMHHLVVKIRHLIKEKMTGKRLVVRTIKVTYLKVLVAEGITGHIVVSRIVLVIIMVAEPHKLRNVVFRE
jgi:hypothetical protein